MANPRISIPIKECVKDSSFTSDNEFWLQICKNTFTMINNTNLQLIQYKVIHRVHINEPKMYKMGFIESDIC